MVKQHRTGPQKGADGSANRLTSPKSLILTAIYGMLGTSQNGYKCCKMQQPVVKSI
jgi:hypothetical protein